MERRAGVGVFVVDGHDDRHSFGQRAHPLERVADERPVGQLELELGRARPLPEPGEQSYAHLLAMKAIGPDRLLAEERVTSRAWPPPTSTARSPRSSVRTIPRRFTDSGIEIKSLYTGEDLPEDLPERLGEPGEYPFARGIHRDMYRGQLWTMRQYAGYASAKESNERYRYLLAHGSTGLSHGVRPPHAARARLR